MQNRMRSFVTRISIHAKARAAADGREFFVVPQNGHELLTWNASNDPQYLDHAYLDHIDGVGREDLFFGAPTGQPTDLTERGKIITLLKAVDPDFVQALVTDYVADHNDVKHSYEWNAGEGFISFASPDVTLNEIPSFPANPYDFDPDRAVTTLHDAKNFLYIIEPEGTVQEFIGMLAATNYDMFIIDFEIDNDDVIHYYLGETDLELLKTKPSGAPRLVLAYMSIGQAEDYRYYWFDGYYNFGYSWEPGVSPEWLRDPNENPLWAGDYYVYYWEEEWQNIIIHGVPPFPSYLDRIVDAGFDGVYLDHVDAFERWYDPASVPCANVPWWLCRSALARVIDWF